MSHRAVNVCQAANVTASLATYFDMEYTCFLIENKVIVDSVYQEDDKKLFTIFFFSI